MIIRRMIEQDVPQVWEIDSQTNTHPWAIEQYYKFIRHSKGRGWVIVAHGLIIGYTMCAVMDNYTHLVNLRVVSEYQGKNVGGLLMRRALKELKQESMKPVSFEMRADKEEWKQVQKIKGLEFVDIREKYYPDGASAYLMRLHLERMKL